MAFPSPSLGPFHSDTAAIFFFENHGYFTEYQLVRVWTWQEIVKSGKKDIISTPPRCFLSKNFAVQ